MSENARLVWTRLCQVGLWATLLLAAYAAVLLAVLFEPSFTVEELGPAAILILPIALHGLTVLRLRGCRWYPKAYAALFTLTVEIELYLEWQTMGSMGPLLTALMMAGPVMWAMWVQAALHLGWSWLAGSLRCRKKEK